MRFEIAALTAVAAVAAEHPVAAAVAGEESNGKTLAESQLQARLQERPAPEEDETILPHELSFRDDWILQDRHQQSQSQSQSQLLRNPREHRNRKTEDRLDFGILGATTTMEERDNHRRRFLEDSTAVAIAAAPIAYTFRNMFCVAGFDCDPCRVDYNDPGDPSAGYSLFVDCTVPDLSSLTATVDSLKQLCSLGFCKGGCEFDPDRYKFEIRNCGWNDETMDFGDIEATTTTTPTPQPSPPETPTPTLVPTKTLGPILLPPADSLFAEDGGGTPTQTQSPRTQSAGFTVRMSSLVLVPTAAAAVVVLTIAAASAIEILLV